MKKLLSLVLTLVLMCGLLPTAHAATDEAVQSAQTLYELGLFRGTGTNPDGTPVFDLDKTPTRNQAVIMLVRLLGKEEEALAGNWELPFSDVAKGSTAYPYIGYAYANSLTNGTSATTYSGTNPIRANQYITFVLRALGYTSGKEFQVSTAWEFSDEIGLTDGAYSAATKNFTRGDVAKISCGALSATVQETGTTLLEKLKSDGAVREMDPSLSKQDVAPANLVFQTVPPEYYQMWGNVPLKEFKLKGMQYAVDGDDIYFRVNYSGKPQKFFVLPSGMPQEGDLGQMTRYAAPASGGVFTCKVSKDVFETYPCLVISPSEDGQSGPDYFIFTGYLGLTEDGTPPEFSPVLNYKNDSYEVAEFRFVSAESASVLGGRLYRIGFINDAHRVIQFWTIGKNQTTSFNRNLARIIHPQAGETEALYFVPNSALAEYDQIYIRVRDSYAIDPLGGSTQEHSGIYIYF